MERLDVYTLTEVLKAAGVSTTAVYDHTDRGAIPAPSVRQGRRNFYTKEEKDMIVSYFKNRVSHSPIGFYRGTN